MTKVESNIKNILHEDISISSDESIVQVKRKVLKFLKQSFYDVTIDDFVLKSDQKILQDHLKLNELPRKCFQGVALRFLNSRPSPTKKTKRFFPKRFLPYTTSSPGSDHIVPESETKDLSENLIDQGPLFPVSCESNSKQIRRFCFEKKEKTIIYEYLKTFDRILKTSALLIEYPKNFSLIVAEEEVKQRLMLINYDLHKAINRLTEKTYHNLLCKNVSDDIFNYCCKLIRLTNSFEVKITKNMTDFDKNFTKFIDEINNHFLKFKSEYEKILFSDD